MVIRGGDWSLAFVVCFLFLIAAPFVLAKARGARGFLEGLGIVLGAWVGCTATIVPPSTPMSTSGSPGAAPASLAFRMTRSIGCP